MVRALPFNHALQLRDPPFPNNTTAMFWKVQLSWKWEPLMAADESGSHSPRLPCYHTITTKVSVFAALIYWQQTEAGQTIIRDDANGS